MQPFPQQYNQKTPEASPSRKLSIFHVKSSKGSCFSSLLSYLVYSIALPPLSIYLNKYHFDLSNEPMSSSFSIPSMPLMKIYVQLLEFPEGYLHLSKSKIYGRGFYYLSTKIKAISTIDPSSDYLHKRKPNPDTQKIFQHYLLISLL